MIAHSKNDEGKYHGLQDHLDAVAGFAKEFGEHFGMGEVAAWLAWWHDAGKAGEDFQHFIRHLDTRHGPEHSTPGAIIVSESSPPLSIVCAGHHTGLPNIEELRNRLRTKNPGILDTVEIIRDFVVSVPDLTKTEELFASSSIFESCTLIRMLFSCLIDADRLDTERHFRPEEYSLRGHHPSMEFLLNQLVQDQEELIRSVEPTPVNTVRELVYRDCIDAAGMRPGIFRLTVPTGGGKTRSAMAFALQHAVNYNKRRVIMALPYTSIIEQVCEIYRNIFGEAVLEHHSAVLEHLESQSNRLATENWDSPIIVTTNVQLFETMFSNKPSKLRKLHNITNSIIILDEVQTLPLQILDPTLRILNDLVENYNCTIVLSSATQLPIEAREIVPDYRDHFEELARVTYHLPKRDESWTWEAVRDKAIESEQSLVITNTIKDALTLFNLLPEGKYHLSTNMCQAHRKKILKEVEHRLENNQTCRLVATQVIEAGVDIDFPFVMRAMAGLDRIIQAGGRCNREGKLPTGHLVVFNHEEFNMPPGNYRTAALHTFNLLLTAGNLHDPEFCTNYFERLYSQLDLDEYEIVKLSNRWQFESISEKYKLINQLNFPVIVPYGIGFDLLDKPINRHFWKEIQPYVVHVYERDLNQAEELAEGLYVWRGGYDETGLVRY